MPAIVHALTLEDLPAPPPDRRGWPWTEQVPPLPAVMMDGQAWPKITIVTPSFNQGNFLEETIRSVLLQGYPNLEYFILDGGSTDQSIEIIQKYEPYLAYWVSQADGGQSHAVNQGFERAIGDLIGWQNSDDYYHPGTFTQAALASHAWSAADIFYGPTHCIDATGTIFRSHPIAQEFSIEACLPYVTACNQAMFFRQRVFQEGQFLDTSLHYTMDHEFLIRLFLHGYRFQYVPGLIGYFRYHAQAKGNTAYLASSQEFLQLYAQVYRNSQLSPLTRQRAAACMRSLCLDHFGKLELDLFRKNVYQKLLATGLSIADLELLLKYALSFLGSSRLRAFKQLPLIKLLQDR